MNRAQQELPRARRDELKVQSVGQELLVFDHANDTAHALNRPAAFVWETADGTRTVDEIAREMARAFGSEADAQAVWYALAQLDKRNLLESTHRVPAQWQGMTRRQFLGRAAAGAALLAVITSISAPSPAYAQSACVGEGQSCVGFVTCCEPLGCCVGVGPTCQTFC